MNLAGVLGIGPQIAGHAVIETHADRNKQIRFLNRVVHPRFAVHAHHPQVERILGGETADAEESHCYGVISDADKFFKSLHRIGEHDSAASQNDRAFGGVEQFDSTIKFSLVVIVAYALGRKLGRTGVPIEFRSRLLRVFGNVHQHRTRSPAFRNDKCFANRSRNVAGLRDHHVVFRNRHGDASDVDFLKSVGANDFAAHLPGDAYDWRRIHHRGGNAGNHVGCART